MNILVLSDVHLEFERMDVDCNDLDLIILAGDVNIKDYGLKWANDQFKDIPVLYVLGNHEFYGKAYPKLIHELKESSINSNIHILERDVYTKDGINFLGCTLWTDFELFGNARIAGYECEQAMADFKKIRVFPKFSKLRYIDIISIHKKSLSWLTDELAKRKGQRNIVITHHAPSKNSLPEQYKGNIVSAAYSSNLEYFVLEHSPLVWIHGHIHKSSNYNIGNTRIICNPRGYPDERNPNFDPNFILKL